MTKFVEVEFDGIVWFCVRVGERTMKLYPSHRVGDCRRPGVRMN